MVELSRYVVEAVIREGRSYPEVAAAHGVSKSWVAKVVGRFREGGYEAIKLRSKAPHRVPHRIPSELEDRIVLLRKQLTDAGFDAGAATIHYHLCQEGSQAPSVATIWRVLRRRGFVTPQPHKRPRSSWIRFEAQLPNECWQSDVTHWRLADDTEVEICNFLDDYSRLVTASHVFAVTTARAVVSVFRKAARTWGLPASVLTQRVRLHRLASRWSHRHGGRAARPRHRIQALAPLPPADLRQGRAVPPDPQALPRPAAPRPDNRPAAQIDRFIAYYNECVRTVRRAA